MCSPATGRDKLQFCIVQYLDIRQFLIYFPRHYRIRRYAVNQEDVTMRQHTTRLLSAQDFLIYRTLFSFLSIPLFFLMSAAAIIAG